MYLRLLVLLNIVAMLIVVAACSPARDASKAASGQPSSEVAANATLAASTVPTTAATSTPRATPAPQRQLTVTAIGYGSGSFGTGYGFTIRNENASEAAELVSVQIAWQDPSGAVLGTETQSISVLGPSEHTGVGGTTFSSAIKAGAKMTVQALAARWTPIQPIPTFTFSNSSYIADTFSAKITAVVKSPYTKDLKLVRISAIGVDAGGQIIGGGFTFLDFVPANGTAAVSVTYSGARPANIALYGQLTSLSLL